MIVLGGLGAKVRAKAKATPADWSSHSSQSPLSLGLAGTIHTSKQNIVHYCRVTLVCWSPVRVLAWPWLEPGLETVQDSQAPSCLSHDPPAPRKLHQVLEVSLEAWQACGCCAGIAFSSRSVNHSW